MNAKLKMRAALVGAALILSAGCGEITTADTSGSVDTPTSTSRSYSGNLNGRSTFTTPTTARRYIPYAGNGGGPTRCRDGTWSNSSGRGTCSHHGGIAR